MRGVLVFKWAKNPQDARVGGDGSVDWSAAKMAVSDDDAAAAEVALVLGVDELVGLTLGDGDASWAAARGASRTVSITDALPDPDACVTAAALALGVEHIGDVDVVVIGDGPWDPMVPASFAAQLGWRALGGVVSAVREGALLRVTQRTPGGTQVIDVVPPVVLGVRACRVEQRSPGMREVLAARKKPLEKVTVVELGGTPQSGVKVCGTVVPAAAQAHVFDGDPDAAVKQLVSALRSEGAL